MRFTVTTLLAVVTWMSVVFASFMYPKEFWAFVIPMLAFNATLVAIVGSRLCRGEDRAFCQGFATAAIASFAVVVGGLFPSMGVQAGVDRFALAAVRMLPAPVTPLHEHLANALQRNGMARNTPVEIDWPREFGVTKGTFVQVRGNDRKYLRFEVEESIAAGILSREEQLAIYRHHAVIAFALVGGLLGRGFQRSKKSTWKLST